MRQAQPYPEFTCGTHRVTTDAMGAPYRQSSDVELTPIVVLILVGAFCLGFLVTSLVQHFAAALS